MKWEIHGPQLGFTSGITGDTTEYYVHILDVSTNDSLADAFHEFLHRLLTEGPTFWTSTPRWLWIQFAPHNANFVGVFTSEDFMNEQPGVYKVFLWQLGEEYENLPDTEVEIDDADTQEVSSWDESRTEIKLGSDSMRRIFEAEAAFEAAHEAMKQRYLAVFQDALKVDPIPQLLQSLRTIHGVEAFVADCGDPDERYDVAIYE